MWILGHYQLELFPSFPFDKCEFPQTNPVSTMAPEKLFLKHYRHSFIRLIGPRVKNLHLSQIWVLDHFLFLLPPEEDSPSDLFSLVFVTERLLPIPWKTAQVASVSHIWGSGSQKDKDASPKVLSLLPHLPILHSFSRYFPIEYSWKQELQYYEEPSTNKILQ